MTSVLSLKYEAFRLSLLVFVSEVLVTIGLFLDIHRWPRSLSSLVRASTRRYFLRSSAVSITNRQTLRLLSITPEV
ncbi:MAG: hypothetical protein RL518_2697 [Pseudomonadota bacterium]|jgi:hypothetical protein